MALKDTAAKLVRDAEAVAIDRLARIFADLEDAARRRALTWLADKYSPPVTATPGGPGS